MVPNDMSCIPSEPRGSHRAVPGAVQGKRQMVQYEAMDTYTSEPARLDPLSDTLEEREPKENTKQHSEQIVSDDNTPDTTNIVQSTEEAGTTADVLLNQEEKGTLVESDGSSVIGFFQPLESFDEGEGKQFHLLRREGKIMSINLHYVAENRF